MDHKEDNKLIAEFMGLSYCTKYLYEGWYRNSEHNHRICDFGGLKYNHSWDWLMPVVKKIELMNKETGLMGVFILFGLGRTRVQCYKSERLLHEIDILEEQYGIQPTYQAVVEFIKWYNNERN